MKNRFIACVLALVLVLSMFTVIGTGAEEAKPDRIPVDNFAGTELNIAVLRRDGVDKTEDFNTKPVIKMVEEATGIHVNWTVIDDSVSSERVSALLASQELPDAMLGLIDSTALVTNKEMFYDFTQDGLLETYAPDVLKSYEEGGQNCLKLITLSDGSVRSLVGNVGTSYETEGQGIMMINQKWLDAVGKKVPATAEEFLDVLRAFRDNDANGNGDPNDEIPLDFCNNVWVGWFMQFANPWGIAGKKSDNDQHYLMLKDGVVTPTMDTQAYRDFLEYFHVLAEEGLLNVEGFSQTNEQYKANRAEGRVGVALLWEPPVEYYNDYVVLRPFKVEGYEPVKTGAIDFFNGTLTSLVASAKTTKAAALLHWWNYMSSTLELKMTARYGIQGETWYLDENGKGIALESPQEGLDPNAVYINALGHRTAPYLSPKEMAVGDGLRARMVGEIRDLLLKEYISDGLFDPEKVEERSFIQTDLFELISSFMATSVVNGVTDESWNAYLNDLKTYQYYEWIDWWQGHVEGKY